MRRKAVDLFLAQLFPLGSSILTTFATATILGPAERGKLALVLSTAGLIGAVGFLSLQVGIVRAYRMGDRSAPRHGFMIALVLSIGVCALGVGTAFLSPRVSIGLFDRQSVVMAAGGGALVIFNLVVLRTRQGLGDSRVFRDALLIQSAVFPVLGIPIALVYHSSTLVIWCWFIALMSSTIFALIRRVERQRDRLVRYHASILEILNTSISAHVGVAGQQLLHSADVLILGLMTSAISVGVYSIAVPIAGLIWVFTETLSLLAFDTGARHASATEQGVRRLQLVRANFLVGLVAAAAIGLGSFFFIPIFLPQYAEAVPLILILLPGVLIQGYARIGLSSILTAGAKRPLVLIGVISALLSALYIPFVQVGGTTGAAIASSMIYSLQTLVVFWVVRGAMKRLRIQEANAIDQ